MKKEFLNQLIECPSPSGDEKNIQKLWMEEVKDYVDEIQTDVAGNVYGVINPEAAFKVLLAGHCDEIAFMVKYVDDKGFVYVDRAGGISPKVALGNRVRVLGKNKTLKGVICVPAEHKGGAKNEIKIEDIIIDLGASSKEDVMKEIEIGDYIIYDVDHETLMNDLYAGRALDNRSGAFIIAEALKRLSKEKLNVGVYGVSTVNEETTMGGAHFAAARIQPNMAIACDVTFATDAPGSSPSKDGDVKMGGGPVISKGSQINYKINDLLKEAAENNSLPLQVELTPRGTGTDADRMRFAGQGVPVALISLPLRYMHSPSEVMSWKDVENEIQLIVQFIKGLSGDEDLNPLT
jgi:endoglucanase